MDIITPTRTLRLLSFSTFFSDNDKGRIFSGLSFTVGESGTSFWMLSLEMATVVWEDPTDFSSSSFFRCYFGPNS